MKDEVWAAMTPLEQDAKVVEVVLDWTSAKGKGKAGDGLYRSPQEKRCKMLWGSPIHKARIRLGIKDDYPGDGFAVQITSTWQGAGMVIAEMTKRGYLWKAGGGGTGDLIQWARFVAIGDGGGVGEAFIQGPPDKAAPSAIALAAVRAMGDKT